MTSTERSEKAFRDWQASGKRGVSSHSVHKSIHDFVAAEIEAAVAEERVACTAIATKRAMDLMQSDDYPAASAAYAARNCDDIAAAICARGVAACPTKSP